MSSKRYYIAYGSNLSVEQMAHRCPDAKIAGMATLKDWRLCFKIHADIEPCEGRVVPVLVWEISEADEANLDIYEGYPSFYYKQQMGITMTDIEGRNPKKVNAMAYIMNNVGGVSMPPKRYYDVLAEGYGRFGFDSHMLQEALMEAKEAEYAKRERP